MEIHDYLQSGLLLIGALGMILSMRSAVRSAAGEAVSLEKRLVSMETELRTLSSLIMQHINGGRKDRGEREPTGG